MDKGFDGHAFLFVGFMGLADDQAIVVFGTGFFDACDGFGKEILIDVWNDDPHCFGETMA